MVLQAAAAEVVEHGIAAADVDRIARSARVDVADVTAVWPRREALLREGVLAALGDGATGLRGDDRARLLASLDEAAVGDPYWADVVATVARSGLG